MSRTELEVSWGDMASSPGPFYFSMWCKCVWGPQMSSLSLVYCLQSDLWIFSLWTPGAVTCGFNVEFRACELFWYCAHISPLACMCGSRVASQSHVSQFLPDCHHFRKGFLFKLQIRSSILTYNWQLCRKCLHHFVVKLEKQNNNVFFVCCTLKWCQCWKQREAFLHFSCLFSACWCFSMQPAFRSRTWLSWELRERSAPAP